MKMTLVRWLRGLGWFIAAMAILPVLVALLGALVRGPTPLLLDDDSSVAFGRGVLVIPSAMWLSLLRTLGIATLAVVLAFIIALPAAYALVHVESRSAQIGLSALVAWPLLAPPCVVAYAWTLLATQKNAPARLLTDLFAWHSPGMAPIVAAWIQANWLWPIPALAMAGAYRLHGHAALRLALLDATPGRAFRRAALPAMSVTLLAAAAIVVLISLGDSAIAPLMLVRTWSSEMMDEATRAHRYVDPTRFVIWRAWPMLVVVGMIAVIVARIVRPLFGLSHVSSNEPLGDVRPRSGAFVWIAVLLTVVLSLIPLVILVEELAAAPAPMKSIIDGLRLNQTEWRATLIVAALAGVSGLALGLLGITQPGEHRWLRRVRGVTLAALLLTAALPPMVIARSLIWTFDHTFGIPASWNWEPYDDTPLAWVAGIVARFGFLPMLLAWMSVRAASDEAVQCARVDGATRLQALTYVQLPTLIRPIGAGAALLACFAMSELPVASMVAPVRFGGSLAVSVDQQVHFGRQSEVIATTLVLALPAMLTAALAAWLMTRDRRASLTSKTEA